MTYIDGFIGSERTEVTGDEIELVLEEVGNDGDHEVFGEEVLLVGFLLSDFHLGDGVVVEWGWSERGCVMEMMLRYNCCESVRKLGREYLNWGCNL